MSAAAQALKEAGNNAFRAGKHEEAISLYTEAMKKDPSDATYPLNRSMAYLKLQKYAEAERDATKSLNLLPAGNPKAFFRRGTARKALGKIDAAKQDFEAALKEEPSNAAVKAELEALGKATTANTASKPASSNDKGKGRAQDNALPPMATKPNSATTASATIQPKSVASSKTSDTSAIESSRRSALKAAITPEPDGNNSDFMQPVSTRRLDSHKATSSTLTTAEISASTAVPKDSEKPSPPAAAPVAARKDFRSLRAARDERTRSSPSTTLPTPSPSPAPVSPAPPMANDSRIPQVAPPKTMYEFEKRWNDRSSWQARAGLLLAIEREEVNLPELFGQNLSPELVDGVIRCLADRHAGNDHHDSARGADEVGLNSFAKSQPLRSTSLFLLEGISRCARFDFVSMLCGETASLKQILDANDPRSKEIFQTWGV